ncbi:hypothetical protein SAMN05421749_103280 [Acinetobacter marinus]|uniref:Uncharacterized protein n=1 Tax=Acinetobacter marinus TaxID=281375 RepID=A0A1G6J9G3_9GAMM|nr:hypothetical protein [Acinetobacter marinus]SDC15253.1 hypothetical protein SAMN05421749_103280 [Acinetobacter marinus]
MGIGFVAFLAFAFIGFFIAGVWVGIDFYQAKLRAKVKKDALIEVNNKFYRLVKFD